ncbi:MAG: hypothetical protein H6970_12510 [Gammaproteobacteria bacterium]|nr:hypothetical protein [Gammaproteobacteria bacterium]
MNKDQDIFSFVALADRPCHKKELSKLENLIGVVNSLQPSFLLHVGGNATASLAKSEKRLYKIHSFFHRFHCPVIFTPGEREWVDAKDPFACLELARTLFHHVSKDFSETLLNFSRQAARNDNQKLVENVRWVHGHVLFLTLHTVGSNNNLGRGKAFNTDFTHRNKANLSWLDAGFSLALEQNLKGIVICTHADLWSSQGNNSGNGYLQTLQRIRHWIKQFSGSVLVVHGERDSLLIDQPLTVSPHRTRTIENMLRIGVPGGMGQGVAIGVDVRLPGLFSVHMLSSANTPLYPNIRRSAERTRQLGFPFVERPAPYVHSG